MIYLLAFIFSAVYSAPDCTQYTLAGTQCNAAGSCADPAAYATIDISCDAQGTCLPYTTECEVCCQCELLAEQQGFGTADFFYAAGNCKNSGETGYVACDPHVCDSAPTDCTLCAAGESQKCEDTQDVVNGECATFSSQCEACCWANGATGSSSIAKLYVDNVCVADPNAQCSTTAPDPDPTTPTTGADPTCDDYDWSLDKPCEGISGDAYACDGSQFELDCLDASSHCDACYKAMIVAEEATNLGLADYLDLPFAITRDVVMVTCDIGSCPRPTQTDIDAACANCNGDDMDDTNNYCCYNVDMLDEYQDYTSADCRDCDKYSNSIEEFCIKTSVVEQTGCVPIPTPEPEPTDKEATDEPEPEPTDKEVTDEPEPEPTDDPACEIPDKFDVEVDATKCLTDESLTNSCPDDNPCVVDKNDEESTEDWIDIDISFSVCDLQCYCNHRRELFNDLKNCISSTVLEVCDFAVDWETIGVIYNSFEHAEIDVEGSLREGFDLEFEFAFCGSSEDMRDVFNYLVEGASLVEETFRECSLDTALARCEDGWECLQTLTATITHYACDNDGCEVESTATNSGDVRTISMNVAAVVGAGFAALQ